MRLACMREIPSIGKSYSEGAGSSHSKADPPEWTDPPSKRKPWYKRHSGDEWFDEIRFETAEGSLLRIATVPRYKTSDLSGDEWRTSARVQVARGKAWSDLDTGYQNLEAASKALYSAIFTSHPELHGVVTTSIDFYRKGIKLYEATYEGRPLEFLHAAGCLPWAFVIASEAGTYRKEFEEPYCFQPGCPEKAISTYELKHEYCRHGHETKPDRSVRRRFCSRHLQRGDCGLEDADDNYTVIEGPGPDEAEGWQDDESPSMFGGVIDFSPDAT